MKKELKRKGKCYKLFILSFFLISSLWGQNNAIIYSDLLLDSIIAIKLPDGKKSKSLKDIATSLKIDDGDSLLQYHILAKWVVNNINYREEAKHNKSLIQAIKKREGICYHYSLIFDSLCQSLGFDSYYITGYVKDFSKEGKLKLVYHAWNAVKIDGEIYMSDLTWSDGNNKRKSKNSKLIRDYFMISPEKFILSHFPEEKKYKFTQYSFSKFKRTPIIEKGFLLIEEKFIHNINVKTSYKRESINIKLTPKSKDDFIEVVGLELLSCLDCSQYTEVIKFKEKESLDFFLPTDELKKLDKKTPVFLLLEYKQKNSDDKYITPIIHFKWR